jgi:rhodanese-related sulfurtransferase
VRATVDDLVAAACRRIERLSPREARAACDRGALIVDIRSSDARRRDGVVPGSLHLPRTVLEWRVDPASPWRNPAVSGLDMQLIVICEHGHSSALAAATLVDLGFARAADVVGGFEAWRTAGLPVSPPRSPLDDELPGLGPPD